MRLFTNNSLPGNCITGGFLFFLLVLVVSDLIAQRPGSPRKSLAVDEVTLASGKKMYGIVINQNPSAGLTMAVERDWFAKTYPKLYAARLKSEIESQTSAFEQQVSRLEDWKQLRAIDADLVEFIAEELARLKKLQQDQVQSGASGKKTNLKPFSVIKFRTSEIKDVFVQPPERRQVAGCAWKHNVDRVSTRTAASLQRELKKRKIDVENEIVDLSSWLPTARIQSDIEWNARVGLFEYVLRKPLDYQGMGSTLVRIESEKPANPDDLLRQMMGGGLGGGGGLSGLLEELNINAKKARVSGTVKETNDWWKSATKSAEADGFRGVRITRVVQDFSDPVATVDNHFFALIRPRIWKQVTKVSARVNRNEVEPTDLERVKSDPQVQKVLSLFGGLGVSNDRLLETAARHGAATDLAMKESEVSFFEFIDRYTKTTDGPPLSIK